MARLCLESADVLLRQSSLELTQDHHQPFRPRFSLALSNVRRILQPFATHNNPLCGPVEYWPIRDEIRHWEGDFGSRTVIPNVGLRPCFRMIKRAPFVSVLLGADNLFLGHDTPATMGSRVDLGLVLPIGTTGSRNMETQTGAACPSARVPISPPSPQPEATPTGMLSRAIRLGARRR